MKAIIMDQPGGTEALAYREVNKPVPGAGQVLVKVHATSVNFLDTVVRAGKLPPGLMPPMPFIPGLEASGVVVEGGDDTTVKVGTNVAFLGKVGAATYAEYVAVDADKLVTLDNNIDMDLAAAIPLNYTTAYHMIHNLCHAESGKTAMIYAASGGVGTALIQLCKLAGVQVVALERKHKKIENALRNGADFAINTTEANWQEEVKDVIGGVDYIFNPVWGDTSVDDLELLLPLGHIVMFGAMGGLGEHRLQDEAFKHYRFKSPTISFSSI